MVGRNRCSPALVPASALGIVGLALVVNAPGPIRLVIGSMLVMMGAMVVPVCARVCQAMRVKAKVALHLEELISEASILFWQVDTETGTCLSITGDTVGLLGYRLPELVGRPLSDVVARQDRRKLAALVNDRSVGRSWILDAELGHQNGDSIAFRHVIRPPSPGEGSVVSGLSFDIAEIQMAGAALRQYRDLFFHLSSAVIVASPSTPKSAVGRFTVSYANPACIAVLGIDIAVAEGKDLRSCIPELTAGQEERLQAGEVVRVKGLVPALDQVRSLDLRILRLSENAVAVLAEDITQAVVAEETVRYQAEHDSLTGLANRSVLQTVLRRLSNSGYRRAADDAALLMLDLDRFKEVNDTLGHAAGDELLRIVAQRLIEQVGDGDLVARLGGDEFAILLSGKLATNRAVQVARKITAALEAPALVEGIGLTVHASIGIALAPDHGTDPETLLRRADIAMYEAKRTDRGHYLYQMSGAEPTIERLALSGQIGNAIAEGQFELWFQPKLELATGLIVGAEGLVRWRHPQRGILTPSKFLELVALAGEYHHLTDLVLDRGIAQAAQCAATGHNIEVSVNVSALSLVDERICGEIGWLLDRHNVSPNQIILEITESDALGDATSSRAVLNQLGDMGIQLSIDDFGTGHSSLVRLRHIPVAEVKIDRRFVTSLHHDEDDYAIVRSIVALAHDLGHRTVAESVDSPTIARLLTEMGCDQAQGYLFSPPVPSHLLIERLNRSKELAESDLPPHPRARLPLRRPRSEMTSYRSELPAKLCADAPDGRDRVVRRVGADQMAKKT